MQCEEVASRVNKLVEQGEVLVIEVQQVDDYKVMSKLNMTLNRCSYNLLGVAYYHQYEGNRGHFLAIVSKCGGYWHVDGLHTTITTGVDSWTNAVQMPMKCTHNRFQPHVDAVHTSLVVYERAENG